MKWFQRLIQLCAQFFQKAPGNRPTVPIFVPEPKNVEHGVPKKEADSVKKDTKLDEKSDDIEIPKRLDGCYPPFARQCARFLKDAREKGIPVYPCEGLRTFERQGKLYEKGRRGIEGEKKVTNAKAGTSFHNYGLGMDVAFDGDEEKLGVQWSWADRHPWHKIGELAESFGLEWAGRWVRFKELGHFQNTYGLKIHQLRMLYDEGKKADGDGLKRVWRELDEIRTELAKS